MESTELLNGPAYKFEKLEAEKTLLFSWKHVAGLEIALFKEAIQAFAETCLEHRPKKAAIDATLLDQQSPAVSWLRGNRNDENDEDYQAWWIRVIVPIYNSADTGCMSVATGDPQAPGVIEGLPDMVGFKVGYFPDLDAAIGWQP